MATYSSKGYKASVRRKKAGSLGSAEVRRVTTKDKIGGAIEATRFWGSFLDDSNAAMASPKFLKYLWMGIPDEWDLRRQIWPTLYPNMDSIPRPPAHPDLSLLDFSIMEQIRMELEEGQAEHQEALEQMLALVHLGTNQVDKYWPGSVQLGSLLYQVCGSQPEESYKVLVALHQIMEPMLKQEQNQLYNLALVAADVISRDMPQLCECFNALLFDVVDFAHVLSLWVSSFFAYDFPKDFVLRVLDVLFHQGPGSLLHIVYGIISVSHSSLERANSLESLYDALDKIPGSLNKQTTDKVFKVAFDLWVSFPEVLKLRFEKNWQSCIELPGVPGFQSQVGDSHISAESLRLLARTSEMEEHRKTMDHIKEEEEAESAKEEEFIIEDVTFNFTFEQVKQSTPEDLFPKIQALLDVNIDLSHKIEDFFKDMKDRNARIARLENDLEKMENELKLQKAKNFVGSFNIPQLEVNISKFVGEKLALEHGDLDSLDVQEAQVLKDKRYDSFSLNEFLDKYSTVHENVHFPCVYMEGFLFKLTKSGLFGKSILNRRFFVLKGKFLTYFKSHLHSKPSKDRCLDLNGAQISTLSSHPKGEFCFQISQRKKCYILFAPDEKELYQWLIALKAAVIM